ncbi:UDP-GlcNAc--UDP-phosphate GlcNAc-1-phosphate transferase, partial [Candidatus Latescibacterota bacterium]
FIFPFYADELTTMAVRLNKGENLIYAHRSHLYQLMANEMNMEHWKVSVIFSLVQLLVGSSVLMLGRGNLHSIIVIFLVMCYLIFSFLSYKIRKNIIIND